MKEARGIPAITGQVDPSIAIHIYPQALQPFRGLVNAYAASILSTFIGFPLDTVKTRMQTHKHFRTYWHCVSLTYHHDGIRGFFRGVWAPLILTSFSKSLSVSLFTHVKPLVYTAVYGDSVGLHPLLRNVPVCFISGMVAGGGVSLFACPFEFTKVYAQLESLVDHKNNQLVNLDKVGKVTSAAKHVDQRPKNLSTIQIARQIVKYEGVSGLYSGFRYHVVRDALLLGMYYSIYESMKYMMNVAINGDAANASPISILFAGGLLGVVSWAFIFPVDTTKLLIQKDIVSNILRKLAGIPEVTPPKRTPRFERKAYRGLGILMTRSFVVNMVFFSAFETAMTYLA